MNNAQLLEKMKKVRSDLQNVSYYLGLVEKSLESGLSFDGKCFKKAEISDIKSKADSQRHHPQPFHR